MIMTQNTIETVMGAVVLTVAAVFLWFAYNAVDVQSDDGVKISAEFGNIGGLVIGDEVRLSGIKIGKVTDAKLDPTDFDVIVTMAIDDSIGLPADSSARIAATSLLGGNYIDLIPGFDDAILSGGDVIYDTRDPTNLSDLLGKAVFSSGAKDN